MMTNSSDKLLGDGPNDFGRAKQSGFDRRDWKILTQDIDLLAHDRGADRLQANDFPGCFRDYACHRGNAVNAKCSECFKVGLQSCPSAAVRSGDAESNWDLSLKTLDDVQP